MAAKKPPGARRAGEAARRAAAAQRIGPRPVKQARPQHLYDLKPPGVYYREWDAPQGTDEEATALVNETFGSDSDAALAMRFALEYRRTYGPHVPLEAARQLDQILIRTDLGADMTDLLGTTPEETRNSLHSLHARGVLLIADDGSLWMTVPPGTAYSAANNEWTFIEKKAHAPEGID